MFKKKYKINDNIRKANEVLSEYGFKEDISGRENKCILSRTLKKGLKIFKTKAEIIEEELQKVI